MYGVRGLCPHKLKKSTIKFDINVHFTNIDAFLARSCEQLVLLTYLLTLRYVSNIVVINVRKKIKNVNKRVFYEKIKNVCKRDKKRYPIFTCF